MSELKLAVVTGANSGVGKATTLELVRAGWGVVMVCRSEERGGRAMMEILGELPRAKLQVEWCDLGVLDEVRALAERLDGWLAAQRLELTALVNNAGVYRARLERTRDGFERTMAINHLGHFHLTLLLQQRLRRPGARVVNVSSEAHRRSRVGGRNWERVLRGTGRWNGAKAYCDSKLANILFTQELHRRWGPEGTVATAVHPGMLSTAIWDRNRTFGMKVARLLKPLMGPPEAGGKRVARVVADLPASEVKGAYFSREKRVTPGTREDGGFSALCLWEASEQAVTESF
ncbi:MAG: SDR family NAD(P)-dependent oxidoreductase [Gemmatimonadales bacterium]|jgi:NAD(P)-dependent dehydrogenase (short-subunit alcohol dehydrogenase family)|nr:MAG: SDR family NAD(P)-dependent oxidoreductase [Gemmatimonadales bacterium]